MAKLSKRGTVVDKTFDDKELQNEQARNLGLDELRLKGVLHSFEGGISFNGTASGAYTQSCDRCLVTDRHPYELALQWIFEPGTEPVEVIEDFEVTSEDELDDPVLHYDGETIDLNAPLWEEIAFSYSQKYLCKEDCKGLCTKCGANLNKTQCECKTESDSGGSGLSALADMFPDLPSTEE